MASFYSLLHATWDAMKIYEPKCAPPPILSHIHLGGTIIPCQKQHCRAMPPNVVWRLPSKKSMYLYDSTASLLVFNLSMVVCSFTGLCIEELLMWYSILNSLYFDQLISPLTSKKTFFHEEFWKLLHGVGIPLQVIAPFFVVEGAWPMLGLFQTYLWVGNCSP